MPAPTHFHQIAHLPGRTIDIEGQEYLYFSGTAYLGLPHNPAFQGLIQEGLHQYGSVYGSSRNGNLQLTIYEQAEQKLASWAGADAALTLSSGMLAGQAAVRQLMLEGYEFRYSPDVHPAVWHLPQVEIPKGSFTAWHEQLTSTSHNSQITIHKLALVTNSVDALRGKLYDFEWVNQLPDDKEFVLLVDDSHGLGVTGTGGRGVWDRIPKTKNVRLIVTASLAKAMGLPGGVIFSDPASLHHIRYSAYFGGCSPVAPDHLYAYVQAEAIYQDAYKRLQANIRQFTDSIRGLNLLSFTDNYPVFYSERDELYPFLLERGIFIYSFSYPKPTDKANTRVVLSAWHTPDDIQKLSAACRDFAALYL
ncbi:aminotransferase class I/II-fold pyridoxal phosphate-dependent enzyme [Runella salmonicolor]|uniref:Aminotransferase class I/II-fold pyridoxal phosphate-dependent enzyme n=1 Tax=Runella salmonicolor TaxID=2950278 RepID=A0ABT1FJB5_9BACT|nr:aminotransferase class I/II-fold pyridoxal phosphate-dependent enzyme [Runella salmonicolor]MCP1381829.1 aminotransferase class I/II-fold pyridoxal phosphate-dependent enzyme [Runella salmonicolor]